jgi:hypothetical protein
MICEESKKNEQIKAMVEALTTAQWNKVGNSSFYDVKDE